MFCRLKAVFAGSALLAVLGVSAAAASQSEYQIYGSYNMGCMSGSVQLPAKGAHYVTQQWGQGRSFAHPMMIDYLHKFIQRAADAGLPAVVIGDLSQRRGGPYAGSNHASHMIGLDVDIPFGFAADLPQKKRTTPAQFYLVKNGRLTANFDEQRVKLIYLAAQDERVERIFVSPRIKEGMCRIFGNAPDNDWLGKLRPWFGHRAHMHVRLRCPADSPYCRTQAAVPEGTGCGEELQSWFLPPDPKAAPAAPRKKVKPVMPEQCRLILGQTG